MQDRSYDFLDLIVSLQKEQHRISFDEITPIDLYQYMGIVEGISVSDSVTFDELFCVWGPWEDGTGSFDMGYQYG
jgi:hypothetical protein